MSRFPAWGTVPTRPRCDCCGNVIVVDIEVDDELWCSVMREKFGPGYVCINCFASRADEKHIDWAPHVTLTAISLAAQMKVQSETAAPECPHLKYSPEWYAWHATQSADDQTHE